MGSQDGVLVDVVGVCFASSRVIRRKPQGIKVLINRYYGREIVVRSVAWEPRFYELASDQDWMIFLQMQPSWNVVQDSGCHIRPFVGIILLALDFDLSVGTLR